MLAALLLCTAWAAQAQNLTVKVNDKSPMTGQASLQAAIEASTVQLDGIISIEITAGTFATEDWNYLKDNRYDLSSLESFTITDGISSVADMPDLDWESYFGLSLISVSIDAEFHVGNFAFYECFALTSISLPKVTVIGWDAFYYCVSLTTVSLPAAISIGSYAFSFCRHLTFLELGGTPPTVGENVFDDCFRLRFLKVDDSYVDAYKNIEDGDKTDNLWYGWRINENPKPLTIKVNDGTAIADRASLEEAIAESHVSPDNVTQLEVISGDLLGADFRYMYNFTSMKLILTTATEFGLHVYNYNDLKEFSAPKLETLGNNGGIVFEYCYGLTSVKLPNATSILNGAFFDCRDLTFLELGATPPTVGEYGFSGCSSPRYLKLVDAEGNPLTGDALSAAVEAYKKVDDGNDTDNLWYGWRINEQPTQLTVKVNGGSELQGNSLQAIVETSGVAADAIKELEIVSGDFLALDISYMYGLSVEKFTMSAEIDELGLKFEHTPLREFYGPRVKSIGNWAFAYCGALTTVSLPAATSIGHEAFQYCSALTTVSLPAATNIGEDAFYECSALTTVSLPAAPNIGDHAFSGCSALTFLELGATPPPTIGNNIFYDCPSPRYLKLVDAEGNPLTGAERQTALANYKADSNWDNTTSTWAGWNLMLSISAMATPAEGGSVSGTGSTAIGSTVTLEATPNEGYRFVRWTDGTNELSTDNPYIFTATDDAELVAEFEIITYTLSYTAGANGSLSGALSQIVAHGQSGTAVEAVAADGYKFLRWSDGRIDNPRTDTNVKAELSVEAEFIDASISIYTLAYTAAEGGSIKGTATQNVITGQSGTEVEAMPNAGYRFVQWSDGLTTAKRTDSNVQGDITVTAEFAINTYTLSYTAGNGGSISGQATQSVQHGQSGTEVEAVANEGYVFKKWSDGLTTAKRTDSNVQGNINAMAEFEKTNTTGLFNSKFESLSAYPNPTTGRLWVSVPEPVEGTAAEVLVYNTAGQLLQRVPARAASTGSATSRISIDLSSYPSGLYIVRVGNAMAKVVKQ